jgi:hypothetical protein
MKAIGPATQDELHSQSEAGWVNERTYKPKIYMLAGHKKKRR